MSECLVCAADAAISICRFLLHSLPLLPTLPPSAPIAGLLWSHAASWEGVALFWLGLIENIVMRLFQDVGRKSRGGGNRGIEIVHIAASTVGRRLVSSAS